MFFPLNELFIKAYLMDEFDAIASVLLRFATRSSLSCESVRSFFIALSVGSSQATHTNHNESKCMPNLAVLVELPIQVCTTAVTAICENRYASCVFWDAVELQLKEHESHTCDGFEIITSSAMRESMFSEPLKDPTLESKDYLYSAQRAIRADVPPATIIQSCFIHTHLTYSKRELPTLVRPPLIATPRATLLRELALLKSQMEQEAATLRQLEGNPHPM